MTKIDPLDLESATLIAESNELAIYAVGNDTYALVHRHAAVEWQAITISGDGLFRMLELSRTERGRFTVMSPPIFPKAPASSVRYHPFQR